MICFASLLATGCSPSPAPPKLAPRIAAIRPLPDPTNLDVPKSAPPQGPKVEIVPALVPEPFSPPGTKRLRLVQAEGALIVIDQSDVDERPHRVGRIVGERIVWIGSLVSRLQNDTGQGNGLQFVEWVYGRWPDALDLLYATDRYRTAAMSHFRPLTKHGTPLETVTDEAGWFDGYAIVGASSVVARHSAAFGSEILTVRGPKLTRHVRTRVEAGCQSAVPNAPRWMSSVPAIRPRGFGASRNGVLISIGFLCGTTKVAAEIWDVDGNGQTKDLSPWWQNVGSVLRGPGHTLWLAPLRIEDPILQYEEGKLEPLLSPTKERTDTFVSPNGSLYVADRQALYRYDHPSWTTVAFLGEPKDELGKPVADQTFWKPKTDGDFKFVVDDEANFWLATDKVYRLRAVVLR